jgi:hypothetical protein
MSTNQRSQLSTIDNPHPRAAEPTMRRFTMIASTLFDAARPRATDEKQFRDLGSRHASVVRTQHPITKILRIRLSHP